MHFNLSRGKVMLTEVELSKIFINERSDQQVIFLREKGGNRLFPIFIGIYEAAAIDRKVKNITTPRPLTHDLIINILKTLNTKLEKVLIDELRDNTFFAKLILKSTNGELAVDSRPSDAIVLATSLKVPIFVEESILNEVALRLNTTDLGEGNENKKPKDDLS